MTDNTNTIKGRGLTDDYHAIMKDMAEMLPDVMKLEVNDNVEASKRLRRAIRKIKNKNISAFQEKIKSIVDEIKPVKNKVA